MFYQHKSLILQEERCELFEVGSRGWLVDVPEKYHSAGWMSNNLHIFYLVRALMPRPPDPPSQFSPALLRWSWILRIFRENLGKSATTCWGQGWGLEHGEAGTTQLLPWRGSFQTKMLRQPFTSDILLFGTSLQYIVKFLKFNMN